MKKGKSRKNNKQIELKKITIKETRFIIKEDRRTKDKNI